MHVRHGTHLVLWLPNLTWSFLVGDLVFHPSFATRLKLLIYITWYLYSMLPFHKKENGKKKKEREYNILHSISSFLKNIHLCLEFTHSLSYFEQLFSSYSFFFFFYFLGSIFFIFLINNIFGFVFFPSVINSLFSNFSLHFALTGPSIPAKGRQS